MDLPKKTQLISLDSSQRTSGTVDNCVFDLKSVNSKYFIEDLNDVIGIRLIDYHIAKLRSNVYSGAYIIDIQIDEIPTKGQILDQELGTLFARIPIDRIDSVDTPETVARTQAVDQSHNKTPTRYFNPISFPKLTIRQTQVSGINRDREVLQSDCGWYMILELTTIDHEAPKPDKLADAIEELSKCIQSMPPPPPPESDQVTVKKKIPAWKLGVPLLVIFALIAWYLRRPSPPVQQYV